MKKIILTLFLLFCNGILFSQSINVNTTTYTVPQLVQNVLINSPCAQVSNFTTQGNCGIGYFSYGGSSSNFAFQDGVIIRSGNANNSSGTYSGSNNSSVCSNAGDAELLSVSQANGNSGSINDASYMKFNFTPFTDNFSFNFIFASNEYGTYQCTFGDVFAFILTSLSPSDLFPRYIRVNYVQHYSLKALPCVIVWFVIIYQMLIVDFKNHKLNIE